MLQQADGYAADPVDPLGGSVHGFDQLSVQPVILVTTIDICPGVSKSVELRKNDVPEDVARRFCREHGLNENILAPLTSHLQQHLEKAQVKVRSTFSLRYAVSSSGGCSRESVHGCLLCASASITART
jgi:hypothetical protein